MESLLQGSSMSAVAVTDNTSLLFFSNMCLPYALYFYLSKHEFTYRNTRVIKHMLNMCLPHGKHAFTATTLIPNEYRQSSNSSVSGSLVQGSKTTQNAYC
jgi:hypothetical protein